MVPYSVGRKLVARKPTDTVQLKLRFPERLRRNLKQAAGDKHSMNREIVERLNRSFLQQNLLALMREEIEKAFDATAEEVAEKVANKVVDIVQQKLGGSK
jgi:hypothetical protein